MTESFLPNDFYISLTDFLLRAKQQVIVLSATHGLSSMQALTLLVLNDKPRPMNALCKLYDCDASNITGIIDGLEEKGLVSREPHPKDRRIKIICLQPAGLKLQKRLAEELAADSDALFAGLTKAETTQFVALIGKISKNSKTGQQL